MAGHFKRILCVSETVVQTFVIPFLYTFHIIIIYYYNNMVESYGGVPLELTL